MRSAIKSTSLLTSKTATVTGNIYESESNQHGNYTIHGKVAGSGAVSATVNIYASNFKDATMGELVGTLSITGTTSAHDGFAFSGNWMYVWADLTAISGTSAAVDVVMAT